jgi:hypothetical protein
MYVIPAAPSHVFMISWPAPAVAEFGFDLALDCVDDNIEAGVRGAKLW